MITEKYCSEVLAQYPEYITKDQMYRICHISKKTCLFLLESGLVPNIDSGKKTRRFKIKTEDVIDYLKSRDDYPELYKAPDGYYIGNGGKQKAPSFDEVFTKEDLERMRQYYENRLRKYPDVMTVEQVAQFTGYCKNSVGRWCSKQQVKRVQVAQDTTKTKSSMRTLPLVPVFKEKLLTLKEQQKEYRRVCGRCYDKRYLDYICVDEMGTLVSPQYLTTAFPKLLKRNGLRHIRYHDLRHSCASLLLANGVPMKQIQEWLGHSDFSTTANVYAHLDYNSKLSSADAMVNGLKGALGVIS